MNYLSILFFLIRVDITYDRYRLIATFFKTPCQYSIPCFNILYRFCHTIFHRILDRNASCFIGHSFFKYSKSGTWTTEKLIDVSVERKNVKAFCPVSYSEISFFTNGLLSVPGDCFGIFNIFEVNKTYLGHSTPSIGKYLLKSI